MNWQCLFDLDIHPPPPQKKIKSQNNGTPPANFLLKNYTKNPYQILLGISYSELIL